MHEKTMWSFILIIAILETFAMSTIEYSANNKNNYYIFGVFLYGIVAYILYKILISGKLAITNATYLYCYLISYAINVIIIGLDISKLFWLLFNSWNQFSV